MDKPVMDQVSMNEQPGGKPETYGHAEAQGKPRTYTILQTPLLVISLHEPVSRKPKRVHFPNPFPS